MSLLEFLEFVVTILIILFVIFQIVIPGYRGLLLFPMFRKKKRRLQEQLSKARDDVENAQLAKDKKEEVEKAQKMK